ncbi:helix-turn-helix transcriptional regulator [Acutalibacter muris]|uniref:Transcriptional regulator n=1 Tax=Acutalibacter muris TaxID=1796620 RepID=A0A1Z2XP28_9FIRM|nr:helix-turn-helix transcriptional regulator [Acutalibacter muris]ANU53145.1 transcriptional regulator [Hungateiclostridiaceae bacterium KB18]ASB40180.1 transcriptional regulator [Acutalibacter muris]QQR29465.1 helix-turn-helix transcriptional regulator [Acutalibacter muris]
MDYPNIEAERARLGLTKDELAERLGVSRKTLLNWQTGRTEIPSGKLIKLAYMFDCTIDYLLGVDVRPQDRAG